MKRIKAAESYIIRIAIKTRNSNLEIEKWTEIISYYCEFTEHLNLKLTL